MRPATENDLPAIVEIYNASIPSRLATADTEPVSVESRRDWFHKHSPDRYPLLVHEVDGKVVAWAGLLPFYGRPAYRHTAEISIYIAPAQQGSGLGRLLLQETIAAAKEKGLKTLLAYVFSHNARSLRLMEAFGFKEWGHLPDIAQMDEREYSLTILGMRLSP